MDASALIVPSSCVLVLVLALASCGRGEPAACDPALGPALFPAPKAIEQGGESATVRSACLDATALDAHARLDAKAKELATGLGLAWAEPGAACDWSLRVSDSLPELPPGLFATWSEGVGEPDRYAVVTRLDAGRPSSTLYASAERAALFAVRAALATSTAGAGGARVVTPASIADWPEMHVRGVVEGIYGVPYSREDRATTLELLARVRGNTYVYGPKDDLYTHRRWRDPYPPEGEDDVRAAAATADANLLDFVWAVGPGLWVYDTPPAYSIRYGGDGDFAALTAKIEAIRALGVRRFGLFVDDLYEDFAWPEDAARFPRLVDAHVFLMNRLQAYLSTKDPGARLLVVGMRYENQQDGWEAYASAFGAGLDPAIDVMWTGADVGPATISRADVDPVAQRLGRKPILWDNFPWDVTPTHGRAPDLGLAVDGLLANPVVNENGKYETSQFWPVLGTVGDYTWNARSYDPRRSWSDWYHASCGAF